MVRDIEKKLAEAGYKMFGIKGDKENLILSILDTGDTRYLKAIPFLIYNYDIDLTKIYSKTSKKKLFGQIIAITRNIFKEEGITKQIPPLDEKIELNIEDFKKEFDAQRAVFGKSNLMVEKQKIYAERDLQVWLSYLFTGKERQILKWVLEEKPVSKTDYEYYSRKTRKKLNSIIGLYDFAKTLTSKSPKYDEYLFKLKKLLEALLEIKENQKCADIQRFFILNNEIYIFFEKDTPDQQREQRFHTQIKLKEIKDEEILKLLAKYKEYDFT